MAKIHKYRTKVRWTGNKGTGTSGYKDYSRNHEISVKGKPVILTSSDPSFRGDKDKYNPEELLVASLSSCHMLWFLHLCSVNEIVVESYEDNAEGVMEESEDGSGRFTQVILKPRIIITDRKKKAACEELHEEANRLCFIANSVNFPVKHEVETLGV